MSISFDKVVVNPISKVWDKPLEVIAGTKPVQKAVDFLAKDGGKNLATLKKHLPGIVGLYISGFYVLNTIKSDGIPKERKMPLVINNIFCGIFGTVAGYILSPPTFKLVDEIGKRMDKLMPTMEEAEKGMLKKGVKAIVPLFIFTLAFRYLAPVLATPIADKINKFLIKKGYIKDPEAGKNKQDPVPMKGKAQAGQKMDMTMMLNHQYDPNFESFLNKVGFKAGASFTA